MMSTVSPNPVALAAPPSARRIGRIGAALMAALLALSAADGAFAKDKTRNTLIGAGLGAAGGALLTHGDVWGTLGGAAAGGLIGNVLTKDRHDHRRDRRGYYDRGRNDRRDWDRRHRR